MYETFYGLSERPFDLGSNLKFLFMTDSHREALSNLRYGISSRKGVTVLTGEVGTGKTTMVRAALREVGGQHACVHLVNPRVTRTELFEYLREGFGLGRSGSDSKVAALAALNERLTARFESGQYSVLIVDEIQSASDDILEEIRLLTNIESSDGVRLLSIILVGQPEFSERLNGLELRHLKQRVALRCELRPLTLFETAAYIASRIRIAGGSPAAVFTRKAVHHIFEVSRGIPRVVSVLCDNALVNGFATNQRPVSMRSVEEVCRDFDLAATLAGADGRAAASQATLRTASAIDDDATAPPLMPVSASADETVPERRLFAQVPRRRRLGLF